MRLLHVHPAGLPTSLLTNQHRTAHLLLSGIAEDNGIAGRYGRHAGFVAWFHWLTVNEMVVRGMNHESPIWELWARIPAAKRGHDIWIAPRTFLRDVHALKAKIGSTDKGGQMDDVRMQLPQAVAAFQQAHRILRSSKHLPGHVLAS